MSKHYDTKQVILMRTDLRNKQGNKVKSGKLMAQAAHAGMKWLSYRVQEMMERDEGVRVGLCFSEAEKAWLRGSFAKIVLAVDNEEQLHQLINEAHSLHIAAELVVDAGCTEFDGPTLTCGAIGPATKDLIDRITGHLKTY